ncbi:MAG: 30S ribosomal protein S20 [Candidatus Woesebacteria bacterium GW2011_GWB1_39_12]|uniref:Small ribosomal subunit protein bS20 n=2 Tax=Candidatus Woeseibacteriota TaxID=1752722 RepID=A0A0G0M0N3_9BACT|nr:MAG: 30S ribosomal protein S20 [Candidatus Woesebacteria bacterium GW2011_GWA1_39_12]KKR01741.1 MAG: 30S ribosomal protein S20 [Candidatus Woesebacteria bacterium GW2011_GWB1_39_12]
MPVTKTAKRALRSSTRKQAFNKKTLASLEVAIRRAKKSKTTENIKKAFSLADRAAKKKFIHKNKAARIKSRLSTLLPKQKSSTSKAKTKKKPKTIRSSKKKATKK